MGKKGKVIKRPKQKNKFKREKEEIIESTEEKGDFKHDSKYKDFKHK